MFWCIDIQKKLSQEFSMQNEAKNNNLDEEQKWNSLTFVNPYDRSLSTEALVWIHICPSSDDP
ncbi:hypothetical protein N7523_007518 [Penicillium sp. IBT 18751x]|nr:hypothetical protein N7523_007518 [Penicillium sp. IBT 18751x]